MQIYNNYTLFEIAGVKNCERATVPLTIVIFDSKREKYVSAKTEFTEF